jgi:hypothetical protein
MDIQPQAQQSISDDQELAKVLAGINQQADAAVDVPAIEEPVAIPTPPEPIVPEETALPTPVAPIVTTGGSDLDTIKKDALSELRPLVDKLDVTPEEKFDTYLLLLRSTDDQSLIGPAFTAARLITDEARRAQALLDIIKEIDYLSGAAQPAA